MTKLDFYVIKALTPIVANGFPKKLSSPLVWEGSDWKNEAQWVFNLTSEHLKEIDDAVKHFHNHGSDVVALFALETAAEGGTSRISSSWRVYNELAEKRPDLVKTLAEPWVVDGFGRDPPAIERPLLYYLDSKIIIQYARRYFTGFQGLPRSSNIPPITEAQAEALDALHFLAEKYSLGLNFQKGDIQFINNLSIFHARDGFVDNEKQARHLLRLWLRNEELAWKLPKPLEPLWKKTFDVTPEEQTFALDPVIRDVSQLIFFLPSWMTSDRTWSTDMAVKSPSPPSPPRAPSQGRLPQIRRRAASRAVDVKMRWQGGRRCVFNREDFGRRFGQRRQEFGYELDGGGVSRLHRPRATVSSILRDPRLPELAFFESNHRPWCSSWSSPASNAVAAVLLRVLMKWAHVYPTSNELSVVVVAAHGPEVLITLEWRSDEH
ncbi:hypothetical protein NLJ89_g502 [Agrocybe chaxingu]|uniref:TauD/TfdA-like domain-containing protein n=1 Tax=Agrocybe chaxingu TaxID=84603 RepID=A0A9W8TEU8_9AGAR|nr:hypothetical protein NLJ89_g502 [Agrocybe chaxingu]